MSPVSWLDQSAAALRGRLMLFAPVWLGLGVGLYFRLTVEPGPVGWGLIGGSCAVGVAVVVGRWRSGRDLSVVAGLFVALVAAGLLVCGLRVVRVGAPVLPFRYYGPVEGRVVAIDRSQSGALRLTLDRVRLDDVRPGDLPGRVRVSLHGPDGVVAEPGMRVAVTAHLSGPEGPVEPGGFDFQRMAFFRGIGAVGYARAPPVLIAVPEGRRIDRLRRHIAAAVGAAIPGEAGAFAVAVTTGDRSHMSEETIEALRRANLAHLLAISGLHMGLLTGFVFAATRSGLALVPGLALKRPIRSYAALCALVAGGVYLALSGGAVATERAFTMVAVMFGAVLLERRALTLRAVAVAALLLLGLQPEAMVEPGFQMSFAATTALVAVFGARQGQWLARVPRWLRPVAMVAISSLVAGLATAPFAAAHFNRISHYGLIANLLAVPVMGTMVMPLAVLAALLVPFGVEGLALTLMRWPIEWILLVATRVAEAPGATGHVPAPPPSVLPLIALGGLALVLFARLGRGLGLVLLIAGGLLWAQAERPDLLIAGSGGLVGLMGPEGRALSKPSGDGFAARAWLENDGDGADQPHAATRPGLARAPGQVTGRLGPLNVIHLSGRGAADRVAAACAGADLVIIARPAKAPPGCRLIDADALKVTGPLALSWRDGALIEFSDRATRGQRPWTRY